MGKVSGIKLLVKFPVQRAIARLAKRPRSTWTRQKHERCIWKQFSLTVCVSLASTSFWFDYLTESPPQAAVPCRPPVRPELADTELSFFLSAFSVYCCKWLNKRLACRLGTVILHLLTMHISCIAHVRWFGQLPPCVKDDVISSIAVAVIAAHPPVPLSPHELSLTIYVHWIWRHIYDDTCNVVCIYRRWSESDILLTLTQDIT
jgi:hypothetical protein